MATRTRTLKPKLAAEAWLKRGLLDLYLAFLHGDLLNFRAFLLHQTLEKFCKAFLIGTQAFRYEQLSSERASEFIDDFCRTLGHDLRLLLGLASIGVKGLEPWLRDDRLIDILHRAYEEGRYPIPIKKSIWSKHGFPALATSDLDEKAFQVATVLWDGIDQYFQERGEVIAIRLEHPLNDAIDRADWARFIAIWRRRSSQALMEQVEHANAEPVLVRNRSGG